MPGCMFVGEQPGDQEDVIGRPFVGPAGQIMDRAMEEAGIDRRTVYITNAVKHFKFEPRGKRRIHKTPEAPEIQACRFWLDVELVRLRPKLVVAMGGTAARAVLGRAVTITPRARATDRGAGRTDGVRHRPPVVPAARARRGRKGAGIPRLRGRSAEGGLVTPPPRRRRHYPQAATLAGTPSGSSR